MLAYPKIKTLFERDKQTFKVDITRFRRPIFAGIGRWVVTEKIDGTNIRIDLRKTDYDNRWAAFFINGRTNRAELQPQLVEFIENAFGMQNGKAEPTVAEIPLMEILNDFDLNSITLFGEGYGPKIQSGGNYADEQKFILFDILVNDRIWLDEGLVSQNAARLGLERVPLLGVDTPTLDVVRFVQEGFKSRIAVREQPAEGVILKPLEPLTLNNGERVIAKLKTRDF